MGYYEDSILGADEILGVDEILGEDLEMVLGEDDDLEAILGEDYDDDMLGFSFSKALRSVAMPHTLITDRLPKKVQRVLDPAGAFTRRSRGVKRARAKSALSKALLNRVAQSGAVVKSQPPTKARRLLLGVDSGTTLIAAAANQSITVKSVNLFRPELFLVDPIIAPHFLINDIKIGRKSQFLGTAPIAASTLTGANPHIGVRFDNAQISQDLVVSVQNVSGHSARFMGTLYGTTVEG